MRLFFDVNVILDVLGEREPWVEDSAAALSLVDGAGVQGFIAAHTFTTLTYLLSKHQKRERAATALLDLLHLTRAVEVGHETLLEALSLGWNDLEDAVQAVCALAVDADYLVTRDPDHFSELPIPVVSPTELLASYAEHDETAEE